MREVRIKLNERDYWDFLEQCLENGHIKVEEQIYEIIKYYLIIYRKRFNPNFPKSKLKKLAGTQKRLDES
ncbi:MAG: hypothetical protein FJ356_01110 [Thaumarchaeota archaeon]|nr:hypothetical protein [Nitrososphaerota archaeon]